MIILACPESGSRSTYSIESGFSSIPDFRTPLKTEKEQRFVDESCLNMNANVVDTTAGTYSLLGGAAAATIRFSRQGSNPSPARPRSIRGQFFLRRPAFLPL
jgi:hypothetical protein